MRIFYNVKHFYTIFFEFGDRLFTSLTMLGFEMKASVFSVIEENLILHYPKFSPFVVAVITRSDSQRTETCKRNR